MRIHELIVEQQLDEIGLADIGRGIEKGIGGLSKAAGYVAGIPGGVKQQFQTGKARATAGIGGTLNRGAPAGPDPAFTQALQNYQTHGTATAPAAAAAPAGGSDPASMRKQAQDFKKQSDDLMKQADAAERSANQAKAQSNQQTQAAQPSAPANPPAGSPAAAQRVEPTLDQPAAAKPGGFGFNPDTGKPFASAAEKTAYDASPEAKMSTTDVEKAGTAQSPEQIRQAKQAAATGTAQQQMAANPAPAAKPTANFAQQPGAYSKQTTNAPTGIPNTSGPKATQAPAAKPAVPGAAALLQPKPSYARRAESVEFSSKFLGRMI